MDEEMYIGTAVTTMSWCVMSRCVMSPVTCHIVECYNNVSIVLSQMALRSERKVSFLEINFEFSQFHL